MINMVTDPQFMMQTASQYAIFSNLKSGNSTGINTGNSILDSIFIFCTISFLGYLYNCLRRYEISDFIYFFRKCNFCYKGYVSLEFEATEIPGTRIASAFMDYSEAYRTILWFIEHKLEKKYRSQIRKKKEIQGKKFRDYYDDIEEKKTIGNEIILYRIDQTEPIQLTEDISCRFILSSDFQNSIIDGKEKETKRKVSKIIVYSYTLSSKKLSKFIQDNFDEYANFLNSKNLKGQMYFSYEGYSGGEEYKRQIWKESLFKTNKSWNNLFIENKNHIKKNIKQIKSSEELYKRIGKPFQFITLIHSKDFGCGKTSLLKVFCKEVFPDRHIVNLDLSKIKTCNELEQIFLNPKIKNRNIPTEKRIYIIDELDKVCPVILKKEKPKLSSNDLLVNKMCDVLNDKKKGVESMIEKKDIIELLEDKTLMAMSPTKKEHDELNLGFILSLIDGPIEYPNRVMIFTCNDKEKLHDAFVRSGRIDLDIHLKKASNTIAKEIFNHIFQYDGKSNDINEKLDLIEDYCFSQSDIYQACLNNLNLDKIKNDYDAISLAIKQLLEKKK